MHASRLILSLAALASCADPDQLSLVPDAGFEPDASPVQMLDAGAAAAPDATPSGPAWVHIGQRHWGAYRIVGPCRAHGTIRIATCIFVGQQILTAPGLALRPEGPFNEPVIQGAWRGEVLGAEVKVIGDEGCPVVYEDLDVDVLECQ